MGGLSRAYIVVMEKLGLTITEGTIVKWMKSEGEEVQAGEGLFEVATDKLVNEVESNQGGGPGLQCKF